MTLKALFQAFKPSHFQSERRILMAKRGSNICKRKDGRFEGRVAVGFNENGKIKYKSVYARTLSEVKEKMVEVHSIKGSTNISSRQHRTIAKQ